MRFLIYLKPLCLCLLLVGCVSVGDKTSEVNSSPLLPPVKGLSDLDTLRLKELSRIRHEVGNEVWPGFGHEDFGMILVSDKNQWAINVDEMPEYYHPVAVPETLMGSVRFMGETLAFRTWRGNQESKTPDNLYRAFSKEQTGNHFKQSVFFVRTLDGYNDSGDPMPSEVWIHISIHELFHVFQDRYVNYTPEFNKAVEVSFKDKIKTDSTHDKLLEPELRLLAQAACEPDIINIKRKVNAAMKLRSKRWAYIEKKYGDKPDQWERYDAWAEGTAYYVEHQIMALWPKYAEQSLLVKDPKFNGFKDYKSESKDAFCETVGMKRKSYWYSLGFAYSLIMDRLDPNWKTHKPSNLFFDVYFKSLNLM